MSLLSEFLRGQTISIAPKPFVVAHPSMSAAQMPDGVQLTRRKIKGGRVIVKNRRDYANVRGYRAYWPEAGLQEWENHRLIYTMGGWIDFQIGNYVISGGRDFCLVVPPGTPIGRTYPPEPHPATVRACNLLTVMSHPRAVQCFITHSQAGDAHNQFRENYLFKDLRLAQLFHFLMEEINEAGEYHERVGADLLSAFWQILARENAAGHYINPGPVGRPLEGQNEERNDADFKTELLHYLQKHLNQPLNVDRVARAMFLSRAQFARRMRQETGKSFVEFLNDYRMEEAKVLLRDSDWTIRVIAGFLGFQSSTYFQTVFRRSYGLSPSQYRTKPKK